MKQNDKYLKESIDILNREFGQPLPTLEDTMKAHKIKKEGGAGSGPKKGQKRGDYDTGDTAADPHSRDYDADKHGENPHDQYDDNWGDEFDKKPKDEGGPGSGRPTKDGSAKDIEKKMSKAADDANAKMDRDEKEMERKAKEQALKDMGMDDDMFESTNEGPDDVRFARRALSKVVKTEQKFRKQMLELEQTFLRDPRPANKKLATQIKKSYKKTITSFMREIVLMVKRMK